MIDMQSELDDIRRVIWQTRAYIGREMFTKAFEEVRLAAIACDTIARFSNHLSTPQLKELNQLGHQCVEILTFLEDKGHG